MTQPVRLKRGGRRHYLRGVSSTPTGAITARCLIVDDDVKVRQSLARVIEAHGLAVVQVSSGVDALALLRENGEVPLCISDIHMPGINGIEFLREALRLFPDMAILMLTGVSDVSTAVECLRIGALDYLNKPVMLEEVWARVDKALEKRDLVLKNRFYQANLEGRVRELDRLNKQSLINGVQMLVHALEAKDAYTSGHSARVARYAVKTAVQLGFTGNRLEHIRLGGELHDIGKIGTREGVLNKPGPLSPEEFEHIKGHTALGERILAPFLSESPVVLGIVRSHHERMDGHGFPDNLVGDAIPMEARIVAVVDAFDAMTTNRAYRPSRTPHDALEELQRCAGTHFDAAAVDAFSRAFSDVSLLPLSI
jgi:putative two-component system response regulator